MTDLIAVEERRLVEQVRLDGLKSADERNEWGQFATPPLLADDILGLAKSLWDVDEKVRFFDPAIGTGSFFAALLKVFGAKQVQAAHGVELDPRFAESAAALWKETGLSIANADFTTEYPPRGAKYNLLISNPPYVRHHHMSAEYKTALKIAAFERTGIKTSGLAGLYASFLLLCDSWLAPDALSLWLIPSEFMDVNYGDAVRTYLTSRVQLLRIHRFCPSDVQFSDALVSSAVVVFRKNTPKMGALVQMSFGGSLTMARESADIPLNILRESPKWSGFPNRRVQATKANTGFRLGDLFHIKRGLATGSNNFFILTRDEADHAGIPKEFRRPILPGPRHVQFDVVEPDSEGSPLLERRLELIDCPLPEGQIKVQYPSFWKYLESGKTAGIHETYIASKRRPWYSQEKRPPAPFVCTYMGRIRNGKKPFRVIWNRSNATAANVYLLLYPKPALAEALKETPELASLVFDHLRSIDTGTMLDEGRVYGGGLHKLEPRELERVPMEGIADLLNTSRSFKGQLGLSFSATPEAMPPQDR